jgi:hypothetical protein
MIMFIQAFVLLAALLSLAIYFRDGLIDAFPAAEQREMYFLVAWNATCAAVFTTLAITLRTRRRSVQVTSVVVEGALLVNGLIGVVANGVGVSSLIISVVFPATVIIHMASFASRSWFKRSSVVKSMRPLTT